MEKGIDYSVSYEEGRLSATYRGQTIIDASLISIPGITSHAIPINDAMARGQIPEEQGRAMKRDLIKLVAELRKKMRVRMLQFIQEED